MKKLYIAVLFVMVLSLFPTSAFGQVQVSGRGWVTVRDQEGPEFERLRQRGAGFVPEVHWFISEQDGGYIGGGSNGEVTMFVVRRPGGFKSSKAWAYVDTDNDNDTGRKYSRLISRPLDLYEPNMGVDHMVDLTDVSSGRAKLFDAFGDFLGFVPASTDGVSITFQIPVILVGGNGSMDVAVLVTDQDGQDWIPNRAFLGVWEPAALIVPTSSPSPRYSWIFDNHEVLLAVNNVDRLKIYGVAASLNGKDLPLELEEEMSTPENTVYRARGLKDRLEVGWIFSPNRLSFGFLSERGFFSKSVTLIVTPAPK